MMVVNAASVDELKHGEFSCLGIEVGSDCVAGNGLGEEVQGCGVGDTEVFNIEFFSSIWVWNFIVTTDPDLGPCHLVFGQSSGFV